MRLLVCRNVLSHTVVPRWRTVRCATGADVTTDSQTGTPAHLTYVPQEAKDIATLTLMARSAASCKFEEQTFWRSCSLQAQRLLPKANLSELSQFVEVLADVRYKDDELMYNFGDVVLQDLDRVECDTLATVLRAHALFGFRNDRVLQEFQVGLHRQMHNSLSTASGMATSLWSLAHLYAKGALPGPSRELLDAVGRLIYEHSALFSVAHSCQLVEAFAIFREQGDQTSRAMLAMASRLVKARAELTASECASVAWSYAKCRVHEDRLQAALAARLRDRALRDSLTASQVSQVLYGLAKFTCQDVAVLDLLAIECRRRLHLFDVDTMCETLGAIGKTGVSSQVLVSRAAARIKHMENKSLDAASEHSLGVLAMAFGKLQARDSKLFDTLGDAVLRGPRPVALRPLRELVNYVHAFTKVHAVHDNLFRAVAQTIFERYDELSQTDLVRYVHALAKVEFVLPDGLQAKLATSLEDQSVKRMGLFELLKVATAARTLGVDVPSLETHVGAFLPTESRGRESGIRGRNKSLPKRRRKTARKRKWDW